MTAARFTTSHRPMEQRGPIQPMTDEQRRFWQLRRERAGMQQPKAPTMPETSKRLFRRLMGGTDNG